MEDYPILIISDSIKKEELEPFRANPYDSLVKFVVDIEKEIVALGGEMHADAESILLAEGSKQSNLWGANIYPWNDPVELEFTSFINIRPSDNNRGMEIQSLEIQEKVKKIFFERVKFQ